MDLIGAIYMPSKYPAHTWSPYMHSETAICEEALEIADKVRKRVWGILQSKDLPSDL